MSDERMKDVIDSLDIDDEFFDDEVAEIEEIQNKEIHGFEADFKTLREVILNSITELTKLNEDIMRSMDNISEDKTAPRKAETISQVSKTKLEYIKALSDMYKKKNEIVGKSDTEEDKVNNKSMTLQEIIDVMDNKVIKKKQENTEKLF